jgi:hypothetical protein
MSITSEVATLRLVRAQERAYEVRVLDDGSEVRLRRRAQGWTISIQAPMLEAISR